MARMSEICLVLKKFGMGVSPRAAASVCVCMGAEVLQYALARTVVVVVQVQWGSCKVCVSICRVGVPQYMNIYRESGGPARSHLRQAAMQWSSDQMPPATGLLRRLPSGHEPLEALSHDVPSKVTLQKPARQPSAGSRAAKRKPVGFGGGGSVRAPVMRLLSAEAGAADPIEPPAIEPPACGPPASR